jgi:FdrA protein
VSPAVAVEVRHGRWADSARLLAAARAAEAQPGVARAACFMATPANLADARDLDLWDERMAGAGPDDLVIAVAGEDAAAGAAAAARALDGGAHRGAAGAGEDRGPRSLAKAAADLAIVSVPGEYAVLEAHKALGAGMDVLLFSDGVGVEDEVALKQRARALGRLVMGPGAGTAILSGVGLGFANVVRPGPVGVVAAAGTGAQEVTVLLDRLGSGVSDCYGTGGRDLSEAVGAITALDAIDRLAADAATEAIVCVSKPPAAQVAERVLEALATAGKPAAACFVGASGLDAPPGVALVSTLEEAAVAGARIAGAEGRLDEPPQPEWVRPGHVLGLFSGGTLCSEAAAILAERLPGVASNAPAGRARPLRTGDRASGHVCVDLGEEEYTRGRPHPMIDPLARAELVVQAAEDPRLAVLLVDVVLGHGSHPDPAGALAPAIEAARAARPELVAVAHVVGTEADPQVASRQEARLAGAGVLLAPTNAAAARLAAAMVG